MLIITKVTFLLKLLLIKLSSGYISFLFFNEIFNNISFTRSKIFSMRCKARGKQTWLNTSPQKRYIWQKFNHKKYGCYEQNVRYSTAVLGQITPGRAPPLAHIHAQVKMQEIFESWGGIKCNAVPNKEHETVCLLSASPYASHKNVAIDRYTNFFLCFVPPLLSAALGDRQCVSFWSGNKKDKENLMVNSTRKQINITQLWQETEIECESLHMKYTQGLKEEHAGCEISKERVHNPMSNNWWGLYTKARENTFIQISHGEILERGCFNPASGLKRGAHCHAQRSFIGISLGETVIADILWKKADTVCIYM